jgi:fibronectin-binding autotransporter adhesin
VRTTAGTTVNFTGNNLGLQGGTNNSQIILTLLNGGAPTAGLTNGILGGWAVVNGTDFAGYLAPSGAAGGVGALGTAGTSYPTYSTALLTAGGSTDNILVTAASVSGVTTRTINSLKVNPAAAATIAITAANTLTIGTGGLLMAANQTLGISGGNLTSGGNELFAYINANTTTISSAITGVSVALVKSGAGTLTLTGANTYGGGTFVNQGTLAINSVLPAGALTINNAAVTVGAASNIPAATNITLNGGSSLTYTGTNAVSGNITFNNTGGFAATNPIITGGTLTLTGSITSVNDSFSSTPTIASIIDLGAMQPARST